MVTMVSIILPVYNGEKYIAQAISSVLQQTYTDFELIVVNDGSTDQTKDEVLKFDDSRIIYIEQKNQGPSAARNYGMSFGKGKYFAFIDADDLYKPNKIEEQVKVLKKNGDIAVVYNGYLEIDENHSIIKEIGSEHVYKERENLLAMMLFRPIITAPSSIMIRRICYEAGHKYDENYKHGEDYKLLIELLKEYNFFYIPKPLYLYRRHQFNLTNEHEKQIRAESRVLATIKDDEIVKIVDSSTFSVFEKNMLCAKIFMKIEQYQKALTYLEGCLGDAAPEPWFYYGICKYIKNDIALAEKSFKRAIEIENKTAEAYNNLGCIYGRKGQKAESINMFNKALELRPNYLDASFNLQQIKANGIGFKLTTRELRKNLATYNL